MRVSRTIVTGGLLAVFIAACSGAAGATPDGGDGTGPTSGPATTAPATTAPVETAPGGDGGNTGGGSGQIHIEIGGPVPATVDQPFFAFGSRFNGDVAGVQLNFASEGGAGIASITGVQDTFVIGYASDGGSANAQDCELTDWTIGTTSASGSFDCKDGFGTKPDGTYLTGITMKGNFEASQ